MAAAQVLAAVDSPRRVDRRPGRLAAPSGPTPRGEWTPRAATRPGEWTPCSVESPLETLPLATPARSTRPLQRSTRPLRAVHSTSASGPLDLHERSTGPARAVPGEVLRKSHWEKIKSHWGGETGRVGVAKRASKSEWERRGGPRRVPLGPPTGRPRHYRARATSSGVPSYFCKKKAAKHKRFLGKH